MGRGGGRAPEHYARALRCNTAGVTGNPIRAYTDPGGSDPLAESICRIGSASICDPPPDQFY